MSAIFGLCSFDGRPLPPESLSAMQAVMSSWGPDGCTHWRQDNAGLGQALLIATPASRFEVMPLHDLGKKQVVVATARLDNRDELCDAFGIPHPERPTTPDGRLIQLAFTRWGESCPKKLYGDWSLAVWDYGRQRLFLARDQLGNTGLCYYHQPPLFAFASSPKALLALPEVPRRLNEGQLARYLLCIASEYGSHTFWQGLQLLMPGASATITPENLKTRFYWHLGESPPVRFGSDAEYLEGFLDHYRRAVRCRLESLRPVGTELSSGLDSGSVTTLAAEILRKQGKRVTAFTAAPLYQADFLVPGKIADEWPLAHASAAHCGNVEHVPVRAEAVSPVASLERLAELFHEPVHGSSNVYWHLTIRDEAKRRGLGVILTGEHGNASVSWHGGTYPIFFQLVRGDWQAGLRSLTAWKLRHGCSWWTALRRNILSPALRPLWSQRHRLLGQPSSAWLDYTGLHPEFACRLGSTQVWRKSFLYRVEHNVITPEWERLAIFLLNAPRRGAFAHAVGSAFGLEVRDPTTDVKLVEYCQGLPEEQYTCQGGNRMLLRRGMTGLMSPTVLCNTDFGYQGADLIFRLLQYRTEVEALFLRLEQAPAAKEFLDLEALRQTWHSLQGYQTPQTPWIASMLMRGLDAGIFLEKL
jgi:asparagine synthase (glutamine-hydrolysing)